MIFLYGRFTLSQQDQLEAVEELRRLFGREAFAQASIRAAEKHLAGDNEGFEFWRAIAVRLRREADGH